MKIKAGRPAGLTLDDLDYGAVFSFTDDSDGRAYVRGYQSLTDDDHYDITDLEDGEHLIASSDRPVCWYRDAELVLGG